MSWIPSHQYMSDHPKTRRLARKLGIPIPHVVGHLHILWHWCMSFAQDGDLTKYDAEEIACGMMWEGDPEQLIEALVASGFLDLAKGKLKVHNWDEYGGKRLRAMQNDASRKRKARQKEAEKTSSYQQPAPDVPGKKPDLPRTSPGRQDDTQTAPEAQPSASNLDQEADAFFSALDTSDGRHADIRVQRREEENRVDKNRKEYSVARTRACDARLPVANELSTAELRPCNLELRKAQDIYHSPP